MPELDGVAISDTSIRQPVFITMLMLLTIVMGMLSYFSLPVNLYPSFDWPVIAVQVLYPGAGPQSVAEQVAEPVEDAIISINGVKHITSESYEGAAMIIVDFETSIEVDVAEQDVRSKVNAIIHQLPDEAEEPTYFKFDPEEIPVLSVAIFSKGEREPSELRHVVEDEIVPRMQRVEGVGSVPVSGGEQRQINVWLDLGKMQARQILPALVNRSIQTANINMGLGSINAGAQDISLRAPSMFDTPQDISRVQITGTPYRIGDIATIEDGVAEVKNYARLNGEDAVLVDIIKRSDANVVEVAHTVREELAHIFTEYPDLEYEIPRDTSIFVEESTHGAIDELFVASLAAMLVVLFFFRNMRNTLVTIIGLPVILIGTFAAIALFGLTINVITLMALSLSVGLVIDDAIVVRENIFRHTEQGEPPIIASSRGTAEVSLSVVAMTLTLIAVFIPVTFASGIAGIIFKSFGITVASAMALSLIEAFTLAPMTSAHLFKEDENKKHKNHKKRKKHAPKEEHQPAVAQASSLSHTEGEEKSALDLELEEDVGWMGRVYGRILRWSLKHRLIVVLIAIVVVIASFVVASNLQFAFMPTTDQGEFYVGFELQPGAPVEETNKLALQAEQIIMQDPAVELVLANVGSSSGQGGSSPERAEIFVKLHEDFEEPTDVVRNRLRPKLTFLPKLVLGTESRGSSSTQVTGRDVQLQINSIRPIEEIIPLLLQIQGEAKKIEGLVAIDSTYNPGKPELEVHVDPTKIGDLGVTNDDIASSVRTLINGSKATVFRKDGEDTDIYVRLRHDDRAKIEDIKLISVPSANGSVPIGSLVDIELTAGPTTIRRYDRANQVIIGANVVDRNVNEVLAEVRAGLETIEAPPGVEFGFGGDVEDQQESFRTLLVAMALSVLFVYMVLASQFGSFFQPFVIMLAMPFSFVGAFLALQIANLNLDIFSMIGLIMLMGLVVKNSILLIDFTNRLRASGLSKHEALVQAGSIRLRPILMTSIALIAGAVPVAIGLGEGAELRRGISVAVIGGMITSTALTLLMIPTAYSILEGIVDNFSRLFQWRPFRRKPTKEKQQSSSSHAHTPSESATSSSSAGSGDGIA